MAKRRFAQVYSSDDEDEDGEEETPPKEMEVGDEDEPASSHSKLHVEERCGGREVGGEGIYDAKPVGDMIKVVEEKGKRRREYYASFEYDGNVYKLDDSVLLTPENVEKEKPYIAIIKLLAENFVISQVIDRMVFCHIQQCYIWHENLQEITRDSEGSMMVTGQWFYRPEEATRKGGGNFQARDTRELFYSFHLDEVPAESVMHRCVVHFIPPHKKFPARTEHPGFIVQKIYDTMEKELRKLTDKGREHGKLQEIKLLLEKTHQRIGELPDDYIATKLNPKKRNLD